MKNLILIFPLCLQFIVLPTSAALMKFSFEGTITEVVNSGNELWDPAAVVGTTIKGHFLMDTELAKGGREETSYYWWNNIDSAPGALTSNVLFNAEQYSLSSDNDYREMYDAYVTDEFLEYYSGDFDEDGSPVADGITLTDKEIEETQLSTGYLYKSEKLSLGFFDGINDFLTDIRHVPGEFEPQPDWLQDFIWEDDGTPNNGKFSYGSFEYYESFSDINSNQNIHFDSK